MLVRFEWFQLILKSANEGDHTTMLYCIRPYYYIIIIIITNILLLKLRLKLRPCLLVLCRPYKAYIYKFNICESTKLGRL